MRSDVEETVQHSDRWNRRRGEETRLLALPPPARHQRPAHLAATRRQGEGNGHQVAEDRRLVEVEERKAKKPKMTAEQKVIDVMFKVWCAVAVALCVVIAMGGVK